MTETIGVSMIVKDEYVDRLALLVAYHSAVVDKFVIADTGSRAVEVDAYNRWPNVYAYEHSWADSFSEARNSTLEHLDTDWVLHLDADELCSFRMMQDLLWVKDSNAPKKILGYQFYTRNWWAGELGPEMPYHWHCRLFRRKVGKWYLPVHEGVMLKGKTEAESMSAGVMVHAHKEAYLIHSKPAMHMGRANTLYTQLGSGPTP
jgi:hypothetical protein